MKQEQTKLPAHLQALVAKIDADHKRFNLTPMHELLAKKDQYDDFHPIHAIIG